MTIKIAVRQECGWYVEPGGGPPASAGCRHVVEVRREMIDVTMGPGVFAWDEQWSFTDAAGHEHRYGEWAS